MASTVTFTELKTRARQLADQENSGFISDTELGYYINSSCQELYDKLIEAYDDDYYATTGTITTNATDSEYNLPSDFYKLLGLDYQVTSSESLSLRKFNFAKRNFYKNRGIFTLSGNDIMRYRIKANKVLFAPKPNGVKTITVHYIPCFTKLTSGSDTFDGINGWEEYVILDAAIKMMVKEESDPSGLVLLFNKIDQRIKRMKSNRDANESTGVVDTRRINGNYYGDDNGWLD